MKYTEINQTDKSICSQRLPMIHPVEWGFEGERVTGGGGRMRYLRHAVLLNVRSF
jgi:hypothetical protein